MVSHAATSFNAAACHSRITGKQSRKERLANFAILCLVSLVYRGYKAKETWELCPVGTNIHVRRTKLKRAQTIFVQLMKIRINEKHRKISNMYTAVALIIFLTKIKPTRPKKHHTTRTDARWSIYNHSSKYAPLPIKFHRFMCLSFGCKAVRKVQNLSTLFRVDASCFSLMFLILVLF